MSVTSKTRLLSKLKNSKPYREAYVNEHVKTSLPLQIYHLREQRELTQTQLAELARTTQTVISRLEDPNYGNLSLNSLLKIASAFDIGLLVKFVPFSRLLIEFQNLSPAALSVPSFTDEISALEEYASLTSALFSTNVHAALESYIPKDRGRYQLDPRPSFTFVPPPIALQSGFATGIVGSIASATVGNYSVPISRAGITAEKEINPARAGVVDTPRWLAA